MTKNILGYVWYSQKSHYRGISYRLEDSADGLQTAVKSRYSDASRKSTQQEFITPGEVPADLYYAWQQGGGLGRNKKHPNMFSTGYMILSAKAADVVDRFDLGKAALYPVRLWDNETKIQYEGDFYILTHGNRKTGFWPEQSPEARDAYGNQTIWMPTPNPVDDELCFSREVLKGPDIRRDDLCPFGIMLSDRFVQALKDARISRDWRLLRCPVIGE